MLMPPVRISVLTGGAFLFFSAILQIVLPQSGWLCYPGCFIRTGLGAVSLNKRFASNGYQ